MAAERNRAVVQGFIEQVVNAHDWAAAERFVAPGATAQHNVATGDLRSLFEPLFAAFPDGRLTVESLLADGDLVAVRGRVSGTHRGAFQGFSPGGETFSVPDVALYRLADGKIRELWGLTDVMTLLQQLRLIPSGPPPKPVLVLLRLLPAPKGANGGRPVESPRGLEQSPQEGRKGHVRRMLEALNARADPAPYFTSDIVIHHPTQPAPIHRLEGFNELIATAIGGFPDWRLTIEELVEDGDHVFARLTSTGTQTGEFVGFPATDKPFGVPEAMEFRFAGDRVQEMWVVPDLMRQMHQLGLIPPGPPPPPMRLLMKLAQPRTTKGDGPLKGGQMVQQLARFFGLVFLLFGVLCFVPGLTTNFDELAWTGPDSHAKFLGLFQVSILYNIDHIVYGIAGLVLARWWEAARWYALVGAIVWGGVSVYGLVVGTGSDLNIWSTNTASSVLHLVLAFLLLQTWVVNKEDRDKVGFDSPMPSGT